MQMSRNDTKEEKQAAIDQVVDLEREVIRLREELSKAQSRRNAMIRCCNEQIAYAKEHATNVDGWILEREYQGMIDACEEIIAAGEAEKGK